MKKVENLSDIQGLSASSLSWLKNAVDSEEKRRGTPDFEVVELIRVEDGCEGFYMDVEDFQKCARDKKDENYWDMIDFIEQTLYQGSNVEIYIEKFPKDSIGRDSFFGKDNPYEEFYYDEYEEEDE